MLQTALAHEDQKVENVKTLSFNSFRKDVKNYRQGRPIYSGAPEKFREMIRTELEDTWVKTIRSGQVKTDSVNRKPASQAC